MRSVPLKPHAQQLRQHLLEPLLPGRHRIIQAITGLSQQQSRHAYLCNHWAEGIITHICTIVAGLLCMC